MNKNDYMISTGIINTKKLEKDLDFWEKIKHNANSFFKGLKDAVKNI